jgi:DNA-binding NtrC family response regulator/tetratricopeptide (TPR) repeat protein
MTAAPTTETIGQLLKSGRLSDALRLAELAKPETVELRTLKAQLSALVGQVDHAERLIRSSSGAILTQLEEARLSMALGLVHLGRRDLLSAASQFQRTLLLADEQHDAILACDSRQLLLTTLADTGSPEAVLPLMIDTRRLVLSIGEPALLALFHIRVARIEAQRGSLQTATRHLNYALELSQSEENYFVRGQWCLVSSRVAALLTDFEAAARHAIDAIAAAEMSGHKAVETAARSNAASFLLLAGHIQEAENHLRLVVPKDFRAAKDVGPLDNLAQFLLLRGDLQECQAVLEEVQRRQEQHPESWMSWQELEASQTFIRLAIVRGDYASGMAHAEMAVQMAVRRGDRLLERSFRILAAECRFNVGELSAASEQIAALEENAGQLPLGLFAEFQRVSGLLLTQHGVRTLAEHRLRRAVEIASAVGPLVTKQAAQRDFHQLREMEAATDVDTSSGDYLTTALDRAATLLEFSSNPELLGREAFALLKESGACSAVALVARRPKRPPEILDCHGWDPDRAVAAVRASGPNAVVKLGARANRTFELLIEPARDLLSRCTVVAVRKILGSALALEAYRRDERQRGSVWPADELEPGGQEIVAAAPMLETLTTAKRIAPLDVPVLITGETGTGKEVLARAIHRASPYSGHAFVPFNCTAVPKEMVESQLFGYRRGAFTGAHEPFAGVIRGAAGGTLFLDEIGELPLDVQPKFLRFLDTHEIHPLGEPHPLHVDVRVIAATNSSLEQLVAQGRFREDLFYRLNVIRFRLPPLRERREEIPPLAQHLLRRAAEEFRKGRLRLADETLEYLLLYAWPGNVRQLANELRRMAALAEPDTTLTPAHLAPEILAARQIVRGARAATADEITLRIDQPLADAIATIERTMVGRALARTEGRVEDAARLLGISRKGLFLKRRRWGFDAGRAS